MDSNNDKSRKPLSEGQPPLPPELDWERMEAGILQKMEELETGKPSRRPNTSIRIIAAVILLALILLSVKYCSQTKGSFAFENAVAPQKQPVEAAAEPEVQQLSNVIQEPPSMETGENAPIPILENKVQATAKNGSSSGSPSQKTAAKTTQNSSFNKAKNASIRPMDSSTATAGQPTQALTNGSENTISENPNLVADKTASTATSQAMSSPLAPVESRSTISADLLPSVTFFVKGEKTEPKLSEIPTAAPKKSPASNKGRIFLLGGATVWDMGYGSNKPERHDFENTTSSFHTGLSYAHTLKNNFTLNIGLQMQQLESQFEWSQELNNYKITLVDTVLEVRVNTLTGATQAVRGDVELDVPAKRMVHHHNTVRLYQIPFAVGRTWSSEKWQADVMLGGAVSVFSENKGRTLYQGELLDYDGTNTSLVSTQGKLHALMAGRLTYNLTKKIGITTGIQFQKSISNWSREQNIQMRPNILNLEFGLKYSL